jgi:hypothetical protein
MAKKTKTAAAGKPNKSAFVRSLAFDMPSADVIARAKTQGMKLTRNDVHAIRAIARRKTKQPKQTRQTRPSGNARAAGGSGVNKSEFVRSLPGTLSAAEVISRGKSKGIRLSAAQIYTIRANARRKGSKKPLERSTTRTRDLVRGTRSGRGNDSRESDFITAALDLGLTKAEGLISALRAKVVAALS